MGIEITELWIWDNGVMAVRKRSWVCVITELWMRDNGIMTGTADFWLWDNGNKHVEQRSIRGEMRIAAEHGQG